VDHDIALEEDEEEDVDGVVGAEVLEEVDEGGGGLGQDAVVGQVDREAVRVAVCEVD